MHSTLTLLICSLLSLPACSLAHTHANTGTPLQNANHIFNVIHDSMRQWGSSLHHNGVSFFLATVPTGTQLYHGTSKSTPVNGTEWLAFEPEHAMVFARPRWGRPPPPPRDDYKRVYDGPRGHRDELRRRDLYDVDGGSSTPSDDIHEKEKGAGYLHTYAAAKNLRLLYIDGESAAKTNKGTLDSQDVLLFNRSLSIYPRDGPRPGPGGESERAQKACEMAEKEWAGRIDGVLRMEAGFEIILCDFGRDLTPLRIVQVKTQSKDARPKDTAGPKPGRSNEDMKKRGPGGGPDSSRWMRAVTARYDGIGGNRVSLNYDHFVTAFSHYLDLFPGGTALPRLEHLPPTVLDALRTELDNLVLTHDAVEPSWNWQATTDMIVTRYSDELSYLAYGNFTKIDSLRDYIELLLSPFIDYSERDSHKEAGRCASQFLPLQAQDIKTLPALAVYTVAHKVCSTLLKASAKEDVDAAVMKIRSLMRYLDWTTWKECRGCADNEICVVPIWPMGTVTDYDNPSCKPASEPFDRDGESYWGRMHV